MSYWRGEKLRKGIIWLGLALLLFIALPAPGVAASGANLLFQPNQGSYAVDATFDVSLMVDTGGQAINAVEVFVTFPADKLQVVSPSVSSSFISVWVAGPSYSNTDGTLSFQGGLPHPGTTTSAGIISTIKFRAKSSGKAVVKYETKSRVLADDGSGTNILSSTSQASYDLKLPAPAGPIVSSPSHEDPDRWYNSRVLQLTWQSPDAIDYSYILDTNPLTIPDDQAETKDTSLTKTVDADGRWYFHIRARSTAGWGGTTHFLARIDGSPPAKFTPTLNTDLIHPDTRALLRFATTDTASGLDHYEVKVISLNSTTGEATLFTEQTSPYELSLLPIGQYQVVVRAFDLAGNITDATVNLRVVNPAVPLITQRPFFGPPFIGNALIVVLTLLLLVFFWYWLKRRLADRRLRHLAKDIQQASATLQHRQAELQSLVNQQQQAVSDITAPISQTPPLASSSPGQLTPEP